MNCDFSRRELIVIRNGINNTLRDINTWFGFHKAIIGEENLQDIVLEYLCVIDKVKLLIDECDKKIPPI